MSEESLTYRASGVDVEANLEANRRIQAYARRTFDGRVLTRSGLFGGAIGLSRLPEAMEKPALKGRLFVSRDEAPEPAGRSIARFCRSGPRAPEFPLAFLDYVAAARLQAERAADLVGIFSEAFAAPPKIPIIGGETAEMPSVLRGGAWEVIGALFSLEEGGSSEAQVDLAAFRGLSRPALVFSMDGVGTKTKLGVKARRSSGLALDIIHHSLNDILCQGARGIGVLLYVGCHSLDDGLIGPLFSAAEECCRQGGMALMDRLAVGKPEVYLPGEIDVCGAIAGVVETERLVQGEAIQAGDQIIGLPSSGLHTNGYSLARKALFDRGGLELDGPVAELGCSLADALLEPHRNYAPAVLALLEDPATGPAIKGIAHITGGGIKDNLERILPAGVGARIRTDRWRPPPIFELIRRSGRIPLTDPAAGGMYESFNMGIGLALVSAPERCPAIMERLRAEGLGAVVVGEVFAPARGSGGEGGSADEAGGVERVQLL
jgi:phosphoribosylformylglycinamidine cyclo-ligase